MLGDEETSSEMKWLSSHHFIPYVIMIQTWLHRVSPVTYRLPDIVSLGDPVPCVLPMRYSSCQGQSTELSVVDAAGRPSDTNT